MKWRALLAIETITSELPHFLQHLSSLEQRAKLRLAQTVSPPVTHSLCAVRTRGWHRGGRVWESTEMGHLKALEAGWSPCTWANTHILI